MTSPLPTLPPLPLSSTAAAAAATSAASATVWQRPKLKDRKPGAPPFEAVSLHLPVAQNACKMQRVLGAARLLFVELPDTMDDHFLGAYRNFASRGLPLLGRVYRELCFKDANKSDGCRNVWFAEEPAAGDAFAYMAAADAALQLADFASLKSTAKMMARMGHALSATVPAFPGYKILGPFKLDPSADIDERPSRRSMAEAPNPREIIVVDIPDVLGRNPDGSPSVSAAGDALIMTDGTGKIALSLARLLPPVSGGALQQQQQQANGDDAGVLPVGAPALVQVRVFANGCLYKGTLVVCASLPANEIHMPASMKKVRGAHA